MQESNASEITAHGQVVGSVVVGGGQRGPGAADDAPKEKAAAATRRIIEEWKRPMKCSEICEQLSKQGYLADAPDPEMALSTILWRAGDAAGIVRLLRGDGYWLKEKPWEPSGYDPTDEKLAAVRRALVHHFE